MSSASVSNTHVRWLHSTQRLLLLLLLLLLLHQTLMPDGQTRAWTEQKKGHLAFHAERSIVLPRKMSYGGKDKRDCANPDKLLCQSVVMSE